MRSGFLALCGLLVAPCLLVGQDTTPPTITSQPVSVNAYIGDTATLSATVSGAAPISFQWYRNGVLLAGETNASLTRGPFTSTDLTLFPTYQLGATNAYGSAMSVPVAIYVSKRPQTITFAPTTTTAVAGSSLTLTASASSNLAVTFSLVSGAASLNGSTLVGTGGNVVVRANQAGNDTFAGADPVERTFSFVAGALSPFITSPPADQTVNAGSGVTLRASAIGTPAPTYQWQKDGVPIDGATSPTFTLATTTLADSGRYTINATNASGTASVSATITVRAAPTITSAPVAQTVFAGDRVNFSVTVTGFPAPGFQWRKNGVVIAGATNATYSIASALVMDAGRYDVVATNLLGSATSPSATLVVNSRDFSGDYFGRVTGSTGDFVLHVRTDRSAVLLAHLPALQTAVAALDVRVDLSGNFSSSTTTLASRTDASPVESRPDLAAAPQAITVRGTLNDASGTITGTIPELRLAFEGARAARTGPALGIAGLYQAALIGSAAARGYLVVAPDGQAFVLTASGVQIDSARGTIAGSRLVATTVAQAALDLGFSGGAVSGTVRTTEGVTGAIGGAVEGVIGTEHIANLSIRAVTSPGVAGLIAGFVVSGSTSKQVLIRAAGPALAAAPFNLTGVLADPTLQVFRGSAVIGQNDDWNTPAANSAAITAAVTRAGAFPFRTGSADAALLVTLTPGPYSVEIGGGTGNVLAEVYEVLDASEAPGARRLMNVSARGLVAPAAPFIAGFVINGTAPQRVLIRGVGPTLGAAPFNLAGALPNPQLTLFRGPTAIKTNDDWFRDADASLIRDAASRAGAFALGANSLDAAMLLYLEPGAYTAQVSASANAVNATGLVLIEIYDAAP